MPDLFVPLDTTQYTPLHRQLSARSYIINANLKYVDANRGTLRARYASFEQFDKEFEIPQSVIDGMLKEAEKDKIKPKDEDELKRTLPQLRLQMKALVARDLWDMSEYFQVINTSNHIVMKAVERISE